MDLAGLISSVMGTSEQCSSKMYVNGDNELVICVNDTWDQSFFWKALVCKMIWKMKNLT